MKVTLSPKQYEVLPMRHSMKSKEATEALECAKAIMDGMKKKAFDYVGEFNTLLLYLERKVREAEG